MKKEPTVVRIGMLNTVYDYPAMISLQANGVVRTISSTKKSKPKKVVTSKRKLSLVKRAKRHN